MANKKTIYLESNTVGVVTTVTIPKQYLKMEDIRALFSVSYMTVYNWKVRGGIPYIELVLSDQKSLIRFELDKVLVWAGENKKVYNLKNINVV